MSGASLMLEDRVSASITLRRVGSTSKRNSSSESEARADPSELGRSRQVISQNHNL